jgi:hypothetical protein
VFASGAIVLARKPISELSKANAEFGRAQVHIIEPHWSARFDYDSTLSRLTRHRISSFVVPKLFSLFGPVLRRALSLNPPVASDAGPCRTSWRSRLLTAPPVQVII